MCVVVRMLYTIVHYIHTISEVMHSTWAIACSGEKSLTSNCLTVFQALATVDVCRLTFIRSGYLAMRWTGLIRREWRGIAVPNINWIRCRYFVPNTNNDVIIVHVHYIIVT